VVRTLTTTVAELRRQGHEVETVTPDGFTTVPCPSYPEIRLALGAGRGVRRRLAAFAPDAIHIATEGPLGWAARRWCLARGLPFTTSFHTRFPDYLAVRTRLPADWFWASLRRFHGRAERVFVATPTLEAELRGRGLTRLHRWSRGVDLSLFGPDVAPDPAIRALPGPVQLYVGRVAVEKNIEAFLAAAHPGSKVVVGDGPARAELEARFPQAHFLGKRFGAELAAAYAAADVFVFPSRTDTFGLVMIEALACGTPVAAYPVTGPVDVVTPEVGVLADNLDAAIAAALTCDRAACAAYGGGFTWPKSAAQFLAALAPFGEGLARAA
jgi:glycosyltransferase involved in cell wall biosynthesis